MSLTLIFFTSTTQNSYLLFDLIFETRWDPQELRLPGPVVSVGDR